MMENNIMKKWNYRQPFCPVENGIHSRMKRGDCAVKEVRNNEIGIKDELEGANFSVTPWIRKRRCGSGCYCDDL